MNRAQILDILENVKRDLKSYADYVHKRRNFRVFPIKQILSSVHIFHKNTISLQIFPHVNKVIVANPLCDHCVSYIVRKTLADKYLIKRKYKEELRLNIKQIDTKSRRRLITHLFYNDWDIFPCSSYSHLITDNSYGKGLPAEIEEKREKRRESDFSS